MSQQDFQVTRAHLKTACDQKNADLLDKLLELDASKIDDNSLYTDTWGEWWGLLMEAVKEDWEDGVRVLLKHGAQYDLASWGDCMPLTPLEAAEGRPAIRALLLSSHVPSYVRKTDPPLPEGLTPEQRAVNRQEEIRRATGLQFQTGD